MNNPKRFLNSKGQLWLNVGAGTYSLPDFVHLDNSLFLQLLPLNRFMRPFLKDHQQKGFEGYAEATNRAPYLVHNCEKPLPFPKESADHILASHFLEHLYKVDAESVVRGFFTNLKIGGTLHVIVPDLDALVKRYIDSPPSDSCNTLFVESLILTKRTKPSFLMRWREFVGGFGLLHRWMYNRASLVALLEQAGFEIAETNDSPSGQWRDEDNAWQVNVLARKTRQRHGH